MKKITLLIAFFITIIIKAQVINLNPDPNGPIWALGVLSERTTEIENVVNTYPYLELSEASKNTVLQDTVDNSKYKYMRPIFHQSHIFTPVLMAPLFGKVVMRLTIQVCTKSIWIWAVCPRALIFIFYS